MSKIIPEETEKAKLKIDKEITKVVSVPVLDR